MAAGLPIKGKAFFQALRQQLAEVAMRDESKFFKRLNKSKTEGDGNG